MTNAPIKAAKVIGANGLIYVVAMWLLSRLIILGAMLLIAPTLPEPPGGVIPTVDWGIFSMWDSKMYQQIATSGYDYTNEGTLHFTAFFPLFPLSVRAVMSLGLPFEVAGTLVNNLAFLGALMVLYTWVEEHQGRRIAQWTTAALAWFPCSLFGTVIYTEGLFLLLSTAALRAFDRQHYTGVALWGALATATRPTGMALIPALTLVAWRERRPAIAYVASLCTAGGVLLFSLYCGIRFGDPLAFVHAQRFWRPSLGFDWQGWWKMLMQISVGTLNWKYGWIKDPFHPLLFLIICAIGCCLWRYRHQLKVVTVSDGFWLLGILLWLLAGDPLINTITILGGGYLLWHWRVQLTPVTVAYGFCSLGLILASGGTMSLARIAYGVVPLALALGLLLARYPRWGYLTLGFYAIVLASFAVRFSQHLWVG